MSDSTKVFVAICHDRHIDVTVVVCGTFDLAKAECLEWMDGRDYTEETLPNWLLYFNGGDDQRWCCVEMHEVKE